MVRINIIMSVKIIVLHAAFGAMGAIGALFTAGASMIGLAVWEFARFYLG